MTAPEFGMHRPGTEFPVLSVIIPTFNERDNIVPIVTALNNALAGTKFEIVFVDDDSPDGTRDQITLLAHSNLRI